MAIAMYGCYQYGYKRIFISKCTELSNFTFKPLAKVASFTKKMMSKRKASEKHSGNERERKRSTFLVVDFHVFGMHTS